MRTICACECGQRQPGQDSDDQEGRILRLRLRCVAQRDYQNPAPVERESDFRGHQVPDENTNCIGNSLADFPAILWIQTYPPPPASVPASPCFLLQRSPKLALEPQTLAFIVPALDL
jgi:hypothetical protein